MRIVYAGAPEFSVAPLKSLTDAGFCAVAAVTQPDKPVGRKAILTPTPLKSYALSQGIPVYDFAKIREHVSELRSFGADVMVTCAYGQLLTQEVLSAFPKGVYNIHASLLPRWRGASPIQHAILAGDEKTGVTVMKTDIGLDTGDMLLCEEMAVSPADTAATLSEKLSLLGGGCIVRALKELEAGTAVFTKQDGARATLCKKIRKEECVVDFSRPAKEVCDLIRAMNPSPLAYAFVNGKLVNFYFAEPCECAESAETGRVVRADKTGVYVAAGGGCVKITELQLEGGKRMRAADAVNGRKIAVGDVFAKERA